MFKTHFLIMDDAYEAIRRIRRHLGYFYPYKAGSVTLNCSAYDKVVLTEIIDYFHKLEYLIVLNKEKGQMTIKGYCKEF